MLKNIRKRILDSLYKNEVDLTNTKRTLKSNSKSSTQDEEASFVIKEEMPDLTFNEQRIENYEHFISNNKNIELDINADDFSQGMMIKVQNDEFKLDFNTFSNLNLGYLNEDRTIVTFDEVNINSDKLVIYSIDNGALFDIRLRFNNPNFEFLFENNPNIELKNNGNTLILKNNNNIEVLSITNLYMFKSNGKINHNISIERENIGFTFKCDNNFLNDNLNEVHIVFSLITLLEKPLINLRNLIDEEEVQQLDNKLIIGYKNEYEYYSQIIINGEKIAKEILSKVGQSVDTKLNLTIDKSNANDEDLIQILNDKNTIFSKKISEIDSLLMFDIGKYLQNPIIQYKNNFEVEDIVFEVRYIKNGNEVNDSYIDIYGNLYKNSNLRPYFINSLVSYNDILVNGAYLSGSLNKSGECLISLSNNSIHHEIYITSIKENSLKIPLNVFYDSRVLDRYNERIFQLGLPLGLSTNLSQYILKNINSVNKTKGDKEIIYVDQHNDSHVLKEKWFYKDELGKRYIIPKEDTYLGVDQKLKYLDSNNNIHDVEYEVEGDDLTFLSLNSKVNYAKESDMERKQSFFIYSKNNIKREVKLNENGKITIPYYIRYDDIDVNKRLIFPQFEEDEISITKAYNLYSYLDVYIKEDGKAYANSSSTTQLEEILLECELLYSNGTFYVRLINNYYLGVVGNKEYYHLKYHDHNLYLKEETILDITSDNVITDYYESEDVLNIEAQIDQYKEYVEDLENQYNMASKTVSDLIDSRYKNTVLQGKAPLYEENEIIKAEESNAYQLANFQLQNEQINKQIDDQIKANKNILDKLNKYKTSLQNLEILKKKYIEEQANEPQDFIFDKNRNILGFDYYGRLVYITDKYENEIKIEYLDNKIVNIISTKQKIRFQYDKNNILESIIDSFGRVTYFKCENNVLKEIIRKNEQGEDESILFSYDGSGSLISISDSYSNKLKFSCNNMNIVGFEKVTKTNKLSKQGIELSENEKELFSYSILKNKNVIEVTDEINQTKLIYYLKPDGEVLVKNFIDNDNLPSNLNEDSLTSYCVKDKKLIFEVSYTIKDFISSINLTNINQHKKSFTLNTSNLNLENLSNREMLALEFDFSEVNLTGVINKDITFELNYDDKKYIFKFEDILKNKLAIPVLFLNKSITLTGSISSSSIDISSLTLINIYKARGEINEYDDDNKKILLKINIDDTISFSKYQFNNPNEITTLDRYGNQNTSLVLYNDFNQITYQEDDEGNCLENYYDGKGNLIKSKEYNKENSTLSRVSNITYDEKGNSRKINNLMRDKDGNYPQEITNFLPGTDLISTIKYPNKQEFIYGYDFNTLLLTEIASDANGQNNSTKYTYFSNNLVSLSHHGTTFDYILDYKNRIISTKINQAEYFNQEFIDHYNGDNIINGQKNTINYANGYSLTTLINNKGNIISKTSNENETILFEYDDKNNLTKVYISDNSEILNFGYNLESDITLNEHIYGDISIKEEISYDSNGRPYLVNETFKGNLNTTKITYDEKKKNQILKVETNDYEAYFNYDSLGRIKESELKNKDNLLINETFEYLRYGENSIDLVKEHNIYIGNNINDLYQYEYDLSQNITLLKNNNFEVRYKYDELNRLIREDNSYLNKTITYQYDGGGNILYKREYKLDLNEKISSSPETTTSYRYNLKGNKDQLINFNGKDITYDVMSNPLTIGEHNLSWDKRGRLIGYGENISYTYGLNGVRTSKIINGIKTDYYVLNNKIYAEKSSNHEIIYHYLFNKLIGFTYNTVEYIYERNILGDIVKIYQKDNLALVAEYYYDAYGNHEILEKTDNQIGHINPFRYRGYYYDNETGLYYLNSRYYSPLFGRFISLDKLSILDETKSQLNGLNLYMYCYDNPIMYVDPSGMAIVSVMALLIGTFVGAAMGLFSSIFSQGISKGWHNINFGEVFFSAIIGAIGGLIGASSIGWLGQILSGATLSVIETAGISLINGEEINNYEVLLSFALGGVFGLIGGIGSQHTKKLLPKVSSLFPFKSKSVETAIENYLKGQISKKGAQGTMNLMFKKSTFSLSKSLNLIAINNAIDDIPETITWSIVEEVLDLIISFFS